MEGSATWNRARRAGVAAGLVLLMAACSGSPRAVSSPSASVPPDLAFARCVRAHGVPDFPDPDGNGQEPPGTKQLVVSNPRFPSASDACRYLLPDGGGSTQAPEPELTQAQAVRFAECMRTHGYPTFPGPAAGPGGQPAFDPRAAGIDPRSPRVLSVAHGCASQLHLSELPHVTS